MALSRIGSGGADAATITIPGSYQAGDLLIIYAFRSALTAPSLPAGWTTINSLSANGSSYRVGYKYAGSASDTSGTWTNATGLLCMVFRGAATNKTPALQVSQTSNAGSATANYPAGSLTAPASSWLVGFASDISTTTTIETPPSGMALQVDTIGATCEYVASDTNGIYGQGAWPGATVALGASVVWRSTVIEILAEQGLPNNYQFVKVGDGMSVSERIR